MNRLNTLKQTGIALAVAQAMAVNLGSAATITVNDEGDVGAGCTFREAVVTVNAGSDQSNGCFIDVANGPLGSNDAIEFDVVGNSILLTAGEVLIDSDVSINPAGGAITISGDGTDRLMNIESANVLMNSLTLTGGGYRPSYFDAVGGAIYANSSTITINNSVISENDARLFGGGISSKSSVVTINESDINDNSGYNAGGGIFASDESSIIIANSNVSDNSTYYGGAGIYVRSSNISLNNSTVSDNRGSIGGGISATDQSTITLTNSDILGNSGTLNVFGLFGYAGGIYVEDLSILTLVDSNVSGNLASIDGGGIVAKSSTVALTNSTISNNSSNLNSGGIYADSSLVIFANSTISGNSAIIDSGAIRANSTSLNLVNSTVSGNSAEVCGGINSTLSWLNLTNSTISANSAAFGFGGIGARYGSVELSNSIISGNRTRSDLANEIYLNGVFLSASGNVIGDAAQSLEQGIRTSQEFYQFVPLSFTNIIATYDGNAPTLLSNILRPLANNGGPTQTHALVEGSPAVNAGDNSVCTRQPVNGVDQRGENRPRLSCDIGAFEGALEPLIPDPDFFVVPLPNGKTVVFGL